MAESMPVRDFMVSMYFTTMSHRIAPVMAKAPTVGRSDAILNTSRSSKKNSSTCGMDESRSSANYVAFVCCVCQTCVCMYTCSNARVRIRANIHSCECTNSCLHITCTPRHKELVYVCVWRINTFAAVCVRVRTWWSTEKSTYKVWLERRKFHWIYFLLYVSFFFSPSLTWSGICMSGGFPSFLAKLVSPGFGILNRLWDSLLPNSTISMPSRLWVSF